MQEKNSQDAKDENKTTEELHAQIDSMLQAERDKRHKRSKGNNGKVWYAVFVVMACFGLGFLGGLLAVSTQDGNGLLGENTTSAEVVLNESNVITQVVEKARDSVVSINVTSQQQTQNLFFGPQSFESSSAGTGIILTSDGLVVTNKHVIPESSRTVTVVLADGTEYDDVEVIGRDPFNDIAFLQINGVSDLEPAELGNSSEMDVGDKVIAIGNALGQFETTVTSGILSGTGRPITASDGTEAELLTNLFQTDAAINPGNSGGPLLNINGEVIAINTAVAGGAENIGFAIPIDDVKPGITSVRENGELVRPYLGVRYVMITPTLAEELELDADQGALLRSGNNQSAVLPDSPAAEAGLQAGDIITAVNDVPINEDNGLVTTVSQFQVGQSIQLTILRGGEEQTVDVTLKAVPDSLTQ